MVSSSFLYVCLFVCVFVYRCKQCPPRRWWSLIGRHTGSCQVCSYSAPWSTERDSPRTHLYLEVHSQTQKQITHNLNKKYLDFPAVQIWLQNQFDLWASNFTQVWFGTGQKDPQLYHMLDKIIPPPLHVGRNIMYWSGRWMSEGSARPTYLRRWCGWCPGGGPRRSGRCSLPPGCSRCPCRRYEGSPRTRSPLDHKTMVIQFNQCMV